MAAGAIFVIELKAELLLITEGNFFDFQIDWFVRCESTCGQLIAACSDA